MSKPESTRLNKLLALKLGISRRQADDLISSKKVDVNNQPAILGQRVDASDAIKVEGKLLEGDINLIYLALNKPVGYVSSKKRQGDTPTLYELLPEKFQGLKTVGRLDKNSSGLILLTNDGDFAYRMTHPKFTKTKIYVVKLNKPLEPLHQQMISDFGISLEDGPSRLILEKLNDDRISWQVSMSEGRNRQIRRTFKSLGYEVVNLHRIKFGKYELANLKTKEFEEVRP